MSSTVIAAALRPDTAPAPTAPAAPAQGWTERAQETVAAEVPA